MLAFESIFSASFSIRDTLATDTTQSESITSNPHDQERGVSSCRPIAPDFCHLFAVTVVTVPKRKQVGLDPVYISSGKKLSVLIPVQQPTRGRMQDLG